jgi:hypothetical protein
VVSFIYVGSYSRSRTFSMYSVVLRTAVILPLYTGRTVRSALAVMYEEPNFNPTYVILQFFGHFEDSYNSYWRAEDQMGPWGTLYTGSLRTPICVWILSHTTTWPISILYCPSWYIQLEPSAPREVSQENRNSFIVHSNRMATVTDVMLSIDLTVKIHLERIWHQWLSHPSLAQPSTASSGC